MRGAIPSLPNTPSWRGDHLKKEAQGQLYLYIYLYLYLYLTYCVCNIVLKFRQW